MLALPLPNLPYSLDTDALAYGLGATLFQTHYNGKQKPIGFLSRSLTDAENKYSASERECLAVLWELQTLQFYIPYEQFTVYTDHNAFNWLFNVSEPSGRLTRCRNHLAEFNFTIKNKTGADNHHADALSRLLTGSQTVNDDENDVTPIFMVIDSDTDKSDSSSALSTTTITDDSNQVDSNIDLLEPEYTDIDHILATQANTSTTINFNKIPLDEFVMSQHSDAFCAEVYRHVNQRARMPFTHEDNGLLVKTVNRDSKIVLSHSLKQQVWMLIITRFPPAIREAESYITRSNATCTGQHSPYTATRPYALEPNAQET